MSFPDSKVSSPILSPSLNEYDDAQITDENENVLPLVALVPIDASGNSGVATEILEVVESSQVTARRQAPQVICPGGEKIKVMGVVSLDEDGNPVPFSAPAVSGKFQSAVETGTGSQQSIAHGLGSTPSLVLAAAYDNDSITHWTISEGTHDATNVYITATSGLKYKVIAFV